MFARDQARSAWLRRLTPLLLVALLTVPLLAGSPASATPDIAVTVSPAGKLVDGQYVRVSWSGVPEGDPVFVRQCRLHPLTLNDCSYLGTDALHFGGFADASGVGSLTMPVRSRLNASPGGITSGEIPCDDIRPCSIALFTDSTATDLLAAELVEIDFAITTVNCPVLAGTAISGIGTTNVLRIMRGWLGVTCRSPRLLNIRYTAGTSPRGEQAFVEGRTDYAIVSGPMSREGVKGLSTQKRRFAYAPLISSGLVFAYRLYDPLTGELIDDLKLTPQQLALLFTGQVKDLNADGSITALNPDHTFPTLTMAFGRAEASNQTRLLTGWFLSQARRAYRNGGIEFRRVGVTSTYPRTAAITLLRGARSVAREVASPSGVDPKAVGAIGWMDSSLAEYYHLPTVDVENAAGEFMAPTDEAIAAAVKDMRLNPDGVTRWVNFSKKNAKAYPLPMLSYLVTQTNVTDQFDATQGLTLRTFLRYALGLGQKHPPAGYVALPNTIRAPALRVIALIPDQEYVAPSPTPTSTTTIPPTTPPPSGGGNQLPPTTGPTPTSTASPIVAGSPTPGITPQVLPPSVLSSEKSSYVWPVVLAIGLIALLLGPGSSIASKLMTRRKARKGESGDVGGHGGRPRGGGGGPKRPKGPNGDGPKHAARGGPRFPRRRKAEPSSVDDDLPSLTEVPVPAFPDAPSDG